MTALVVTAVVVCLLALGWAFQAHARSCDRLFARCKMEQQTCPARDAAGWVIEQPQCRRFRDACVVY